MNAPLSPLCTTLACLLLALPVAADTLTLDSGNLFVYDQDRLSRTGMQTLNALAMALEDAACNPQKVRLDVIGHTDRLGSSQYNQQLSERRAQAVKRYLLELGLPASLLRAAGHGELEPLTMPNDCNALDKHKTKLIACYRADRRVEMHLQPLGTTIADMRRIRLQNGLGNLNQTLNNWAISACKPTTTALAR